MGRNKKRRPKNTRPQKPRRQIPSHEVEIDALAPAYADWIGKDATDQDSHHVLEYVKMVLAFHRKLQPGSNCTSFRALPLEAAICLCVDEIAEGDDFFFLPFMNSITLYTNFLEQTGRWTGTTRQLQDLRQFYRRTHASLDTVGSRHGFEWPELDQTEQLEFLEGMPLVKKARRMLAALDTQIQSDPGASWRQAFSAAVTQIAGDDPARDVAQDRVFDIYRGLGLNPYTGSAEQLSRVQDTLRTGATLNRLILLEVLVFHCLQEAFSIGDDPYRESVPTGKTLGGLLAQAASTTGTLSGLLLTNPGAMLPAGLTPTTAELYREVAGELKYFQQLGLVVIDGEITVPPALRRPVLEAWEASERERQAA